MASPLPSSACCPSCTEAGAALVRDFVVKLYDFRDGQEVDADDPRSVVILRVLHGAMLWPPGSG